VLLRAYKFVNSLPATLAAGSVYFVKVGNDVHLYATNRTGTVVAYRVVGGDDPGASKDVIRSVGQSLATVIGIRGKSIGLSAGAPSDGHVLRWNSSTNEWRSENLPASDTPTLAEVVAQGNTTAGSIVAAQVIVNGQAATSPFRIGGFTGESFVSMWSDGTEFVIAVNGGLGLPALVLTHATRGVKFPGLNGTGAALLEVSADGTLQRASGAVLTEEAQELDYRIVGTGTGNSLIIELLDEAGGSIGSAVRMRSSTGMFWDVQAGDPRLRLDRSQPYDANNPPPPDASKLSIVATTGANIANYSADADLIGTSVVYGRPDNGGTNFPSGANEGTLVTYRASSIVSEQFWYENAGGVGCPRGSRWFRDARGSFSPWTRIDDFYGPSNPVPSGAGSGLDSDLLDGQHGAYYLDYANFVGTPPGGATPTLAEVVAQGNTTAGSIVAAQVIVNGQAATSPFRLGGFTGEKFIAMYSDANNFTIAVDSGLGLPALIIAHVTRAVRLPALGGSGTRMVVASPTGELSTQAIPAGGGGGLYDADGQLSGNRTVDANSNDLAITAVAEFKVATDGGAEHALAGGSITSKAAAIIMSPLGGTTTSTFFAARSGQSSQHNAWYLSEGGHYDTAKTSHAPGYNTADGSHESLQIFHENLSLAVGSVNQPETYAHVELRLSSTDSGYLIYVEGVCPCDGVTPVETTVAVYRAVPNNEWKIDFAKIQNNLPYAVSGYAPAFNTFALRFEKTGTCDFSRAVLNVRKVYGGFASLKRHWTFSNTAQLPAN